MTNEGSFGMPLAARARNTRAPGDLLKKITSDNLVIPKLWLIRCIPQQIGGLHMVQRLLICKIFP